MGIRWDKLVVRTRMFAIEHKRLLLVIGIVLALILLGVFGTKIYLVMKVVLGHDVIVRLSGNATHLSLENGQSQIVAFETSVVTNPFCSAECVSNLHDISRDIILSEERFSIDPRHPHTTHHELSPQHLGEGQELYRFSVTCQGSDSALCHTTAEPVTRNVIVTLDHSLNSEEVRTRSILNEELTSMSGRSARSEALRDELQVVATRLDQVTPMDSSLSALHSTHVPDLMAASDIWNLQDYDSLGPEAESIAKELDLVEDTLSFLNSTIIGRAIIYNDILSRLAETEDILTELNEAAVAMDNTSELNDAILSHNGAVLLFTARTPMPEKQSAVLGVHSRILGLELNNLLEEKTLSVQLATDVATDALCELRGVCIEHPGIFERAIQEDFDLPTSCSGLATLIALHDSLNDTASGEIGNTTYSSAEWRNITLYAKLIKQQIGRSYLEDIPADAVNRPLISKILNDTIVNRTTTLPQGNLTPALTIALTDLLPAPCALANATLPTIRNVSSGKIPLLEQREITQVVFADQPPMCCVLGECKRCCDSGDCSSNPPLIFIHGHAFNKDTSAEYSLDIFNQVQELLEDDGYLNGGIISITAETSPQGILGRSGSQWSFKGSYYFDAFEEEGSYNIVHTKSENIDTYAIRLKERIDTTLHITGEDKVIIVAHSMGGLVARRYAQIFGSDRIEKLVLVGTPNEGIAGNVADFCPIIGEKLECRDMQENSLFLNKLNRELNSVPTEVIIGEGCDMEGQDGDGIVTVGSAQLAGVEARYVRGSCTALAPLHTELFNIERYPEMYNALLASLR